MADPRNSEAIAAAYIIGDLISLPFMRPSHVGGGGNVIAALSALAGAVL